MKRFIVFLGVLLLFSIALTGCGSNTTVASWTTSGTLINDSQDESWTLSVGRANGHIRRNVTFNQGQLDMLNVRGSASDGELTLTLIQGDTRVELDLAQGFDGFVITYGLEPGTIQMRLDFNSATDVDVAIRWQAGGGVFFN